MTDQLTDLEDELDHKHPIARDTDTVRDQLNDIQVMRPAVDELAQDCGISRALALEIRPSCIKSLIRYLR